MPVSKENQKLYPGGSLKSEEWLAIRETILERAGKTEDDAARCEWCTAEDRTEILRSHDGEAFAVPCKGLDWGQGMVDVFSASTGERLDHGLDVDEFLHGGNELVEVVLTIAHLDHDPGNNHEENLKALCQKCHTGHDAQHKKEAAHQKARSMRALGDLFDGPQEPAGEDCALRRG